MNTARKVGIGTAAASVIGIAVAFLPGWEGMKLVASRDPIGTGHPVDYCYGQTSEFGKVKIGTRFTKQQCDEKLAESLPHYLALIEPCIKVHLPDKSKAALLSAAYNAGPAAVCRSPMVAKMNAGDLRGGCNAFKGWYVRSAGQVRKGLVARRSGIGDGRKSERDLCLEGLAEQPVPSVKATATPVKTRPKWLTTFPKNTVKAPPKSYVCTPRQAEAGECLPLVPPKICGGEWVDDRTYTSHPECRKPTQPPKPAPAPKPSCDFPWLSAACYGGRS